MRGLKTEALVVTAHSLKLHRRTFLAGLAATTAVGAVGLGCLIADRGGSVPALLAQLAPLLLGLLALAMVRMPATTPAPQS